jgi:hypothetical protein
MESYCPPLSVVSPLCSPCLSRGVDLSSKGMIDSRGKFVTNMHVPLENVTKAETCQPRIIDFLPLQSLEVRLSCIKRWDFPSDVAFSL